MTPRSWTALAIGAVSIACAAGAFESGPGRRTIIEKIPVEGDQSAVSGLVLDRTTADPLDGALVILHCSCLESSREAQSNADGHYDFKDLPPGRYTVQFLHRQADSSIVITLKPGEGARLRVTIDPDASLPVVT